MTFEDLRLDPDRPVFVATPFDLTPEHLSVEWSISQGEQEARGHPTPRLLEQLEGKQVAALSVDAWTRAQLHVGIRDPTLPAMSPEMEGFADNRGRQWLERQVARLMAIQAYHGYLLGQDRLRPHWKTLTPTGRIVSERPSLSNWPKAERGQFVAEPGFRWYYVGWHQPELWLLAQQTQSPYLQHVANAPERMLSELWGLDPALVQRDVYDVMARGPVLLHPEKPGLDWRIDALVAALMQAAPEWEPWWQKASTPPVTLPVFQARVEAPADRLHGVYLKSTVALLLKLLLVRMAHWADLRSPAWVGLQTLIPLYEGVYYQCPARFPAAEHAEQAHRVAVDAWQQSMDCPAPEVTVLAGGTWGALYEVTGDALDTVDADLRDAHPNARYEL